MKTAVITGTSSGLGKCLAEYFVYQGWSVIGLSRSPGPVIMNYEHCFCDIQNAEEVVRTFNAISNVDLLINNAAAFEMLDFEKTNIETIDKIIDTNLKGSMYITHGCLPHMTEGAKIIFINSVAGLRDIQHQAIYCASKAGLRSFAGVLGQELRNRKIKVSSIHPGGINTTLWNKDNPYPCGQASDALDPTTIAKLAYMIASDETNAEYKTMTLFPDVEWH